MVAVSVRAELATGDGAPFATADVRVRAFLALCGRDLWVTVRHDRSVRDTASRLGTHVKGATAGVQDAKLTELFRSFADDSEER